MDFEPTAEQQAVADVVTSVLARDLTWTALVDGGVTALAVPERLGGDGVGLLEVSTVLAEVGRHGAVTPALATWAWAWCRCSPWLPRLSRIGSWPVSPRARC